MKVGQQVKIKGTDLEGVVEWIGYHKLDNRYQEERIEKVDVQIPGQGVFVLPLELLETPLREEPPPGTIVQVGRTSTEYPFLARKEINAPQKWYEVGDIAQYQKPPPVPYNPLLAPVPCYPYTWEELNDFGEVFILVPEEKE